MIVDHQASLSGPMENERTYGSVTRAIARALRRRGVPGTPGRIHRLARRFFASGECDPYAYVLSYADPTGERAVTNVYRGDATR